MPSRAELIAHGRTFEEINRDMGSDRLFYQSVPDMNAAILEGSSITELEESCFTGKYIAGNVDDDYLAWVEVNQTS